MNRQGIAILGSTGSIGLSTLDVLRRHADRYRVVALTAHSQVDRLFEQIREFRPEVAVMVDEAAAEKLAHAVREAGLTTRVRAGAAALSEVAVMESVDQIMAAIVGAAGLLPTLAAAEAGKRILLANKEALVMSGSLLLEAVQRSGARLLPIDSEHNAIFQCLPTHFEHGLDAAGVQEILLTGSGGPFRELPLEALAHVTPDQACAHPNWSMGRKISVDSATMMNKGLELIEACLLFRTTPERIRIVVHPQSVIHSMVQYVDGSVLAQLGQPDMRTPIAHALAWPERMTAGVEPLDFYRVGNLEFQAPDPERFPALRLAENAARRGGTAPAILNAANEVAVAAFLDGRIRFTQIAELVEAVVERLPASSATDLDTILAVDSQARAVAHDWIKRRSEDPHS